MAATHSTMLELGTPAPDFALPAPSGRVWTLDDVAGQNGTLVAFVCNHCPYVAHLADELGAAAARWYESGIGAVGINSNDVDAYPDERPAKMDEHATAWNWHFPYLIDADQQVARAYRAACTPDFFLFDADRLLVYRGRFDSSTPRNEEPVTGEELTAAVDALLAGRPQAAEQLPSIGCGIKWKPGNEPDAFAVG